MTRRWFDVYQYAGPAILTPVAVLLWCFHYAGNAQLAAVAVAVPVLYAYIVPGIGTNVLKMWSFNTRFRLGAFRPQHGFVFGSATAVLAVLTIGEAKGAPTSGDMLASGLWTGVLLLAVNWIYDALALRHGVLEVYNQSCADGSGPWAIAGDYVVWFFGVFGVNYGAGLRASEGLLLASPTWSTAIAVIAQLTLVGAALPSVLYVAASWLKYGHSGCRPVRLAVVRANEAKVNRDA